MEAKHQIYNLRNNLEAVGSQLSKQSDQHLMYMIDEARAILVAQKMDRRQNVTQMSQYFDQKARKATPDEIGKIGTVAVLAIDVPKPVQYANGPAIFTVGSSDGSLSYSPISFSQLRTYMGRKYTANSPKWFLMGDTIFLLNVKTTGVHIARVRGIFDEPYKVEDIKGTRKKLAPFSWEYPLTMKDAKAVYQIALTGDLGWADISAMAIGAKLKEQQQEETPPN